MSMLVKEFDFTKIKYNFPSVGFEFYTSEAHSFINCIVCGFKSADSLLEQWETIQNFISVYHQPKTEAERWNVYFILLCPETIDIRNKYIIEKDTYVARKVIIENESVPVESSRIIKILNDELLGFDLKADFDKVIVECNYKSSMTDLLVDIPLDASVSARSIRAEKVKLLVNSVGKL